MRIVDDITDLSKIELKEFNMEKSWFNLFEILEEVSETMSLPIQMKKLSYLQDFVGEL